MADLSLLLTFALTYYASNSNFSAVTEVNWTALNSTTWWGAGDEASQDTGIYSTRITFSDEMIADLKSRLNSVTYTAPFPDSAFTYGTNTDVLSNWTSYWANDYNFTNAETTLNQYPMYKTNIQGLDIFYIHVKPEVSADVEVVPMLLLHGWSGSIREFYEAIPLLTATTEDRNFAVEVIIPCLPGFGYSDAAVRTGLGSGQMAVLMRSLMLRLGFNKYYLQGGDFGGIITSHMSVLFPDEVLGYHTNFGIVTSLHAMWLLFIGSYDPSLLMSSDVVSRVYPLSEKIPFLIQETGYMHEQATKPDTIGVALRDSPAGLMAWILEKFSSGTNFKYIYQADGGLTKDFTKEQLIDNLMLYWAPKSITTSMRIYAESMNKKNFALGLDSISTTVPTWVMQALHEISYFPPKILKLKYTNLINTTLLDYGGHYFALQHPQVFSEDVLKAITAFRDWHSKN